MDKNSKTQMVTVRVQVPCYSSTEAAKKYLPAILDAIEGAPIFQPDEPRAGKRPIIRGASVGTVR